MRTPIFVIMTTYNRQSVAVRTVQAMLQNLQYPDGELRWIICDDGSSDEHYLDPIVTLLTKTERDDIFLQGLVNGKRRGVGWMMNTAIRLVKETFGGQLLMILEDDWELVRPLDISPYADLLVSHVDMGMVRLGYLSPNINATIISRNDRLWWKIEPNGETYRYSGHPSVRHIRFHEVYGLFDEGLPPGYTELSMCGKVNAKPNGPAILIPIEYEQRWGFFHHIGSESLADVAPERWA